MEAVSLDELKRALKEEIKQELLAEVPLWQTRTEAPWHAIREELAKIIEGNGIAPDKASALLNAVSAIIRQRFGVRHTRFLSKDQAEEARRVALAALELAGIETRGRAAG